MNKYDSVVNNPCFSIFLVIVFQYNNFIESRSDFGKLIRYYNEILEYEEVWLCRQKSLFSHFWPFYSNVVNFPIKFCYFAIKATYFPFLENLLDKEMKLWCLKERYFADKNPLFSCFSSFCRIIKIVVIVIRLVVTLCFRTF